VSEAREHRYVGRNRSYLPTPTLAPEPPTLTPAPPVVARVPAGPVVTAPERVVVVPGLVVTVVLRSAGVVTTATRRALFFLTTTFRVATGIKPWSGLDATLFPTGANGAAMARSEPTKARAVARSTALRMGISQVQITSILSRAGRQRRFGLSVRNDMH
jgi:hypothetical protein